MPKPRNSTPISVVIDRLLGWCKWPAGIAALLLLPGIALALLSLLGRIAAAPWSMLSFLIGCAAYAALWWSLFRYSRFSLFLTLEHELTHALFAVLTFHRVTDLKVTARRGGQMQFIGHGNWLISIAPYFFPLASVLLIVLLLPVPAPFSMFGDALIGASFAYHLTSTLQDTHPGQSDIQRTGKLFCLLFLPSANGLFAGLILAFSHNGLAGLRKFVLEIGYSSQWIVESLLSNLR